jgi:sn-glycerol 3-phosphate transport system substrate-binding protein
LESFGAWHNTEFATKRNGFNGLDARLNITSPLHVRHIENLANMAQQGLFVYKGRSGAADAVFQSGECAMYTGTSAAYGGIKRNLKAEAGIGTLPYYPDVPGAPQNTVIGGASLWVISGKKPEEYKGVAKFLAFLSQPEIQMEWHTSTGYVPITQAAYDLTKKSGFYDKNPGRDMPVRQLTLNTPTANSKGLRFGNFVQGRTVIEEELENVFSGKKDAKAALDDAVKRGNEILRQFEAANK